MASTATLPARRVLDVAALHTLVAAAEEDLAVADDVSDEVRSLVLRLGDALDDLSRRELASVDPYALVAIQGGAIQALAGLEAPDARGRRRAVRIGLERVRQALRDLAEEGDVEEGRPIKDVVRWLVEILDAPNPDVARLLGTSARTLQRWLSPEDRTEPRGDDALRVKVVARVTNQLRHAITSEGVFRWFETPHPALRKRPPIELVTDVGGSGRLLALAAATRVGVAT
jgi:uncharacterized protein (DUF2384 family)